MPTTLIRPPDAETLRERQRTGADRFDEVWEGVYFMSPIADLEHQDLGADLVTILRICIDWTGQGKTYGGVNVSNRRRNWRQNYRCPDVAVFLNGTTAVAYKAYWFGGPDFGVEIVSEDDRTFEKIPFYEKVRTRELLVIERDPWALRLYRLEDDSLQLIGTSTSESPEMLRSEVVPLSFQLQFSMGRSARGEQAGAKAESDLPEILVTHHDGRQSWRVAPKPHEKSV